MRIKSLIRMGKALLDKNGPTMLVVGGVITGIAAEVFAVTSTMEYKDIQNECDANIEIAMEEHRTNPDGYSKEEMEEDINAMKVMKRKGLVKCYSKVVVAAILSAAMILGGHKMMVGKLAVSSATLAALENDFNDYRARVSEKYGTDIDRELREARAKGDERPDAKNLPSDSGLPSPLARFFDDASLEYNRKFPEYNLAKAVEVQKAATDLLRTTGIVWYNSDILRPLDIAQTAPPTAGWALAAGDTEVNLGIFDPSNEGNRRYLNGYQEDAILIDPDCHLDISSYLQTTDEILRFKRNAGGHI